MGRLAGRGRRPSAGRGGRAKLRSGAAAAPAKAPRAVKLVIRAANAIRRRPYRYGGGHGSFLDTAYDCSGAVSYALHGGRLLDAPLDSSSFMTWGRRGRGRWITVYTNPGHAYVVVAGLRFDTSGAGEPGVRESGPRWRRTTRPPEASPPATRRASRRPGARPARSAARAGPPAPAAPAPRPWYALAQVVPAIAALQGGIDARPLRTYLHRLQVEGLEDARQGRGSGGDARVQLPEADRAAAEGQEGAGRRRHVEEAPPAAAGEARAAGRQARHAGPPGAGRRQRGARARRARAQAGRAGRAPGTRPAGRRARAPAGAADRLRAEAAHEDRGLPLEEGGHQGAVLRRRGAGPHLRGRQRRGRGDGRRRARHAAGGRQDREHAGPRARRSTSSSRPARSTTSPQLGEGKDDIDKQLDAADVRQPGRLRAREDEGRARPRRGRPGRAARRRRGRRVQGGLGVIVRLSGEGQFKLSTTTSWPRSTSSTTARWPRWRRATRPGFRALLAEMATLVRRAGHAVRRTTSTPPT